MKQNVRTNKQNKNDRNAKNNRCSSGPRLALKPFMGHGRRLFTATFKEARRVGKGFSSYLNPLMVNIRELTTNRLVTDHMYIRQKHWPVKDIHPADMQAGDVFTFVGEVVTYTTPNKGYTDYDIVNISDAELWQGNVADEDKLADLQADFDSACPDVPPTEDQSVYPWSTSVPNFDQSNEDDDLPF